MAKSQKGRSRVRRDDPILIFPSQRSPCAQFSPLHSLRTAKAVQHERGLDAVERISFSTKKLRVWNEAH